MSDWEQWRPLILIGEVQLLESEGGFGAPTIWVRSRQEDADGLPVIDVALDRAIYKWAHGALPIGDRGGSVDSRNVTQGYLRITIERLE